MWARVRYCLRPTIAAATMKPPARLPPFDAGAGAAAFVIISFPCNGGDGDGADGNGNGNADDVASSSMVGRVPALPAAAQVCRSVACSVRA